MSGVLVRPASAVDFDAVARLTVAAFDADGQLGGEHGHLRRRALADVPARAEAGELLVAVDEATGDLLGTVLFVLSDSPYAELAGPGEAEFRMLAVDPSAQGRGVGKVLVRACVARAVELECRAVVISTRNFAAAAHQLYARLGFVRTPERDCSPMPDMELHTLRLELPVRSAALPN